MTIDQVLEALKKREPIFHREELGQTKADFNNMMEKDFEEVSASGSIYTKENVIDISKE